MKPMLAATLKDINDIKYPVLGTPKLDGIRCLILRGQALSRTLKPIPNVYVQEKLKDLPHGLDGELMIKSGDFNSIQSAIMSEDGEPDFVYNVFDYIPHFDDGFIDISYEKRISALDHIKLPEYCIKLFPLLITNEEQLRTYEGTCIYGGYEGIMLRSPSSPYKFGRSTLKEQYLMKLKRFDDSEAEIIGFEELMHNENEAEQDNLGHTKRASKKENLVPAGTLGTLLVRDIKNKIEFGLGTGFTADLRQDIWNNKTKYIGKIVNYKYQGIVDKPRFPSFRGFRDKRDI